MRRRSLLYRVVIALSSTTIALFICELVLKLLQPTVVLRRLNAQGESIYVKSHEYYYDVRPSQTYTRVPYPGDTFEPVENQINSDSLRGLTIPPKASNEFRVLLLGDSFLESEEISFDKTVGSLLNRRFNPTIQFIQKGVSGWSPLIELNWLLKKGLAFDPDLVILFLVENDSALKKAGGGDAAYQELVELDSQGLPDQFRVSPKRTLPLPRTRTLLKESLRGLLSLRTKPAKQFTQKQLNALLTASTDEFERWSKGVRPRSFMERYNNTHLYLLSTLSLARPMHLWNEQTKESAQTTFHYVRQMETVLRQHSIQFAMARTYSGWNLDSRHCASGRRQYGLAHSVVPPGGFGERIEQYSQENNVPFIDFLPAFEKFSRKNPDKLLFLDNDCHWTAHGHQVVANVIADHLHPHSFQKVVSTFW